MQGMSFCESKNYVGKEMRTKTNPGLNLREVISKNKHGRALFKCKTWDCNNLTTGNRCKPCFSSGKRRSLSRCTSSSKRKNVGVSI